MSVNCTCTDAAWEAAGRHVEGCPDEPRQWRNQRAAERAQDIKPQVVFTGDGSAMAVVVLFQWLMCPGLLRAVLNEHFNGGRGYLSGEGGPFAHDAVIRRSGGMLVITQSTGLDI